MCEPVFTSFFFSTAAGDAFFSFFPAGDPLRVLLALFARFFPFAFGDLDAAFAAGDFFAVFAFLGVGFDSLACFTWKSQQKLNTKLS